jgi:hypothetical protein
MIKEERSKMGKESIKAFLSRFSTKEIGGGGDDNEMCENVSVQRPPQCNAVGVLLLWLLKIRHCLPCFRQKTLNAVHFLFFLPKNGLCQRGKRPCLTFGNS